MKIGDNHATINANSLLELESTDKGLLFPRVALTATDNVSPLAAHVEGMVVFNTVNSGTGLTAVSPGMYYNTGTAWEKVNSSASTIPGAPIGSIITMGSTAVPAGYLYCDGSAISRTTYDDLFSSIGTTYGTGDGSTTFNLPDYRGYFLRGQDDGRALDPDAATRTGGDAVGSTQTDEFKSHTHDQQRGAAAWPTNSGAVKSDATSIVQTPTSATGGNETRPVNISVRYCIKFQETEYTGAAGPTGTAGANGSDGSSILNGTVNPTTEGNDGDFYLNTTTNFLFGPKAAGAWGAGVALTGASITNEVIQNGITVSSTGTSPVRGNMMIDRIYWTQVGDQVTCKYVMYNTTGGTNGSGDYLYSLPNGVQFGPNVLLTTGSNVDRVGATFRGFGTVHSLVGDNNYMSEGFIVPYDVNRFRIWNVYTNSNNGNLYVNSGHWNAGWKIAWTIEFTFTRN